MTEYSSRPLLKTDRAPKHIDVQVGTDFCEDKDFYEGLILNFTPNLPAGISTASLIHFGGGPQALSTMT